MEAATPTAPTAIARSERLSAVSAALRASCRSSERKRSKRPRIASVWRFPSIVTGPELSGTGALPHEPDHGPRVVRDVAADQPGDLRGSAKLLGVDRGALEEDPLPVGQRCDGRGVRLQEAPVSRHRVPAQPRLEVDDELLELKRRLGHLLRARLALVGLAERRDREDQRRKRAGDEQRRGRRSPRASASRASREQLLDRRGQLVRVEGLRDEAIGACGPRARLGMAPRRHHDHGHPRQALGRSGAPRARRSRSSPAASGRAPRGPERRREPARERLCRRPPRGSDSPVRGRPARARAGSARRRRRGSSRRQAPHAVVSRWVFRRLPSFAGRGDGARLHRRRASGWAAVGVGASAPRTGV